MIKARKVYLRSAAFILILTASIKLVELLRSAPYTKSGDWVFLYVLGNNSWTIGNVMLLGAALEVMTVCILTFSQDLKFGNWSVVLLCCSFVAYRFAHWAIGAPDHCPCLGNAGDWLKLSPNVMNEISIGLLTYLLAGGTGLLLWESVWMHPALAPQRS
jgi:hypothetical protein